MTSSASCTGDITPASLKTAQRRGGIVVSLLTAGLVLGHAVHLVILELAFQRRGV